MKSESVSSLDSTPGTLVGQVISKGCFEINSRGFRYQCSIRAIQVSARTAHYVHALRSKHCRRSTDSSSCCLSIHAKQVYKLILRRASVYAGVLYYMNPALVSGARGVVLSAFQNQEWLPNVISSQESKKVRNGTSRTVEPFKLFVANASHENSPCKIETALLYYTAKRTEFDLSVG